MELFILLVLVIGVYFMLKNNIKPQDYSVNIPIIEMTPLRRWFHVAGIVNKQEANMYVYALITPLLCMNFSKLSPIMKDEKKIDELIVTLSMPYFLLVSDYAYKKGYNDATKDFITKAGQQFFFSIAGFNNSTPESRVSPAQLKQEIPFGNIDALILIINDYVTENGDNSISIQTDIVPFIDNWCETYFFTALGLLDKISRCAKRLNRQLPIL